MQRYRRAPPDFWGGRLPNTGGHRSAGLAALHCAAGDGHFDVIMSTIARQTGQQRKADEMKIITMVKAKIANGLLPVTIDIRLVDNYCVNHIPAIKSAP